MKTISRFLSLLTVLSVIIISCQKEVSFEAGNNTSSDGILQADITGTCTGVTLGGTYKKDSTLTSSHFVDVTVTVNTAGSYIISTDTINGYYFRGSGNFTATGPQVVRLNGNGKPLATGTNSFTVNYDSTQCEFSVTVVAGTGGTSAFTLNGAPGACTGATVNGTYTVGTVLTSANTAVINVNVTAVGTYSISTTAVNGVVFSTTGTFTVTGPQTITLTASGTPIAAGDFTITVTASGNTCTFIITCSPIAVIDYFPRTTNNNWSYEFDGDPNDSLLRKVISQTIMAAGNTYNVFMATNDASLGFDTSGYFRKAVSDYFEWIDMGSYLGYDSSIWMEYNFLKDNLPQGGTWNSAQFTGPVTPPTGGAAVQVTARFGYRILQKDVSVTVNGFAYPNTIVVEEKLWVYNPVTSSFQDVSASTGFYINYYSRNIGLIKQDYDDGAGLIFPLNMRRYAVY